MSYRWKLGELRRAFNNDVEHDSIAAEFIRNTADEPGSKIVLGFVNDCGEYQFMMEPPPPQVRILDDSIPFKYRII